MNKVRKITITRELITEKEQIWQEHIKGQKESGLSRKAYCVKHHLNYDQFGYWVNKWPEQQPMAQAPTRSFKPTCSKTRNLMHPGI